MAMRNLFLVTSAYLAFPLYPLYNVPRIHAATVAQLAEQAFRKRQVKGSNPFGGSKIYREHIFHRSTTGHPLQVYRVPIPLYRHH